MKVIGKSDKDRYICEVSHTELEKYLNMYHGNMNKLEVGKEIDLGTGYDHADATARALRETREFFRKNADNIKAITNAFLMEAAVNRILSEE